jgi:hypothetical protein
MCSYVLLLSSNQQNITTNYAGMNNRRPKAAVVYSNSFG